MRGMNLIYLHGPPASGKLTVGRALAKLIDARLSDNHASIDFAKTLFDFGTPDFWRLVQAVRVTALRHAAEAQVPNLIYTCVYSEPEDRPCFDAFCEIVEDNGGVMMPVFLQCAPSELAARVANQDRVDRGKLSSADGLETFLNQWNVAPVPHVNCLTLDTSSAKPRETARIIGRHFGLVT